MKRESGTAIAERAGTDRLIDARAVARLLDMSDRSIWKLSASAKLPAVVRVGRSVKWRLSDIQRFIEVGCNIDVFREQQTN